MTYNYKGEVTMVYVDFTDGDHTLEAVPGKTYELIAVPEDGLFEQVANKVAQATADVPPEAPQTAPEAPVEPAI